MKNRHNKTPRVLHLARWYPNRYDPMPGLFIQRHAEAVAQYCEVGVVYTHVVEDEIIKGVYDIELSVIKGVPTAKVYYSNPKWEVPLFTQLIKAFRFYKANYLGIKKIKQQLGGFELVHVHILTRLGLIALYYKWFYNKPFIITEHWSRYLELTGSFTGGLRKAMTKLIVRNALVITTVTQNLANAMQKHGLKNKNYRVLANVVDETFFHPEVPVKYKNGKATFVHVSCFEDKSKNVSGLLRVIKSLSEKRNDFIFRMIGDGMDFEMLQNYSRKLGLDESVIVFTGLLEGKKLVSEMAAADLMVVFSNYENFPVVINESFVLGIPVLATKVGGIPEYVNNSNGSLLDAGDENTLEMLLNDYLEKKLSFNNNKIQSDSRDSFSAYTIGKELFDIYSDAKH
jgi:glycosyltransferase involved in cell wall biosynthesis